MSGGASDCSIFKDNFGSNLTVLLGTTSTCYWFSTSKSSSSSLSSSSSWSSSSSATQQRQWRRWLWWSFRCWCYLLLRSFLPYCVMYVYRLPPVFQRFRKSSWNNFGTKRPLTVGGNRLTIREHCYKSCRKGCLVVLNISCLFFSPGATTPHWGLYFTAL